MKRYRLCNPFPSIEKKAVFLMGKSRIGAVLRPFANADAE